MATAAGSCMEGPICCSFNFSSLNLNLRVRVPGRTGRPGAAAATRTRSGAKHCGSDADPYQLTGNLKFKVSTRTAAAQDADSASWT